MTTQSEVKSPEWVMAELIPESLKKRLNWLQNTVMALTKLGLSSGCVGPVHSHNSRDIPPSQHILGHAGTSATSLMCTQRGLRFPHQGMAAQEKLGFPVDRQLQV